MLWGMTASVVKSSSLLLLLMLVCICNILGLSIDYSTNRLWWVNNVATDPLDYIMSCDLSSQCNAIDSFPYSTLNISEAPRALATYDGKLYILVGTQNGVVYQVNEDGSEPRVFRTNVSNVSILKMFVKETNIHGMYMCITYTHI